MKNAHFCRYAYYHRSHMFRNTHMIHVTDVYVADEIQYRLQRWLMAVIYIVHFCELKLFNKSVSHIKY